MHYPQKNETDKIVAYWHLPETLAIGGVQNFVKVIRNQTPQEMNPYNI